MSHFQRVICTRDNGTATCRGIPGARKVNHSPTGYEWGYGGSGPADLALNILAAVAPGKMGTKRQLCDRRQSVSETAWRYYQAFKWDVIARMPQAGFTLTREDIEGWLTAFRERGADAAKEVGALIAERESMHGLADAMVQQFEGESAVRS